MESWIKKQKEKTLGKQKKSNYMKTEDYIKIYADDKIPLTSQDVVEGINSMQKESYALEEDAGMRKYTFKHLSSLLAEEKMKTLSAEDMKDLVKLRKHVSYNA